MALLRGLVVVLLLATLAHAQIGTPPPCSDAVTDREQFRVHDGRVKFHLRFHTAAGTYDAHAVLTVPRGTDASCTEGAAVDRVIEELQRERQQFLGP